MLRNKVARCSSCLLIEEILELEVDRNIILAFTWTIRRDSGQYIYI